MDAPFLFGKTVSEDEFTNRQADIKRLTGNLQNLLIDDLPKIVYSRTLKNVVWKNSTLKKEIFKEEIIALKQQAGKNIVVGSPGLIVALAQLDVVDEYQLAVQPTVLESGLPLFKNIRDKIDLKLLKIKTFGCGTVMLYYERTKR